MKWNYDPNATTCEECEESYELEEDEPPCDTCDRPQELYPGNQTILDIWGRCHSLREESVGMSGIIPMKLKASEIKADCEVRGASLEEYEGVLAVERIAYPMIMAQYKKPQGE